MNIVKISAKYLDQPLLVKKFSNAVPYILSGIGGVYTATEAASAPKDLRKTTAFRTGIIMAATIASALTAPKIAAKAFRSSGNVLKSLVDLKNEQATLITKFIKENSLSDKLKKALEENKEKVFKFSDFKFLAKDLSKTENGRRFFNELVPEPENITSSEIFSKIGELSLLGFIPVAGGILGGIAADKLTTTHWKEHIPDKIKEGSYQYLANIFLCNIGAGAALGILEKLNIKSRMARACGMVAGICATGIVGGSALANLIGQKVIDPLLTKKSHRHNEKFYVERTPEAIDISLHTDDIATVAVMSGLKWIEPALPIMYSISGYRAGIGYRNHNLPHEKLPHYKNK